VGRLCCTDLAVTSSSLAGGCAIKRRGTPPGDNGGSSSGEGIISCSYHGEKSNAAPVRTNVEKCKLVEGMTGKINWTRHRHQPDVVDVANETPRFNVEEGAIAHLIAHLMLGLRVGWLVALFERSHTAEFHYHAAVEQSSKVAL
jgi:hypothetical protein